MVEAVLKVDAKWTITIGLAHGGPFQKATTSSLTPSSRTPLLEPGPLRTGRETCVSSGSGPSNASFRETRFRHGKMLAVNPVVALWMKQVAILCTRGTTRHTRDVILNAPSRDPGDLGVTHRAEPALEHPEKAKSPCPPKRSRHIVSFAFLPSSRATLRSPSPLRTVPDTFASHGSSVQ
jgi:hypothetical protein